jgi:malate dehydrogenase
LYAGVPLIIGTKVIEKVIEIDLSEEEKKNLNSSIDSVIELFDAAKKIDPSLA